MEYPYVYVIFLVSWFLTPNVALPLNYLENNSTISKNDTDSGAEPLLWNIAIQMDLKIYFLIPIAIIILYAYYLCSRKDDEDSRKLVV